MKTQNKDTLALTKDFYKVLRPLSDALFWFEIMKTSGKKVSIVGNICRVDL